MKIFKGSENGELQMTEKKYAWGQVYLTLEELRKVDPMAASNIDDYTPPPKESKSDKLTNELIILWLGICLGGTVIYLLVK